ncbi:hypothetical protein SAMN05443247_04466 [Bradyrhizobium erythrophlei]|jgi:hypothetical protein|nr:hypothetical protein SAMN05443247_04466 [Bradyrhizobium erythrophlei]
MGLSENNESVLPGYGGESSQSVRPKRNTRSMPPMLDDYKETEFLI